MKGRATFEPRDKFNEWLADKYKEETTRRVAQAASN
jgi:hypothetical protein